MKTLLSLIISSALVVSGYSQTRNVLVGTNNAVVQPTNFWSADASNARAGLGLGSAATNPASAFQPSSAVLSNLAAGGGAGLTNIAASNIVGTLSIGQGGTGATNASDARTALGLGTAATNAETAFQPSSTTLSNLSLGNGGNLTNLQATSLVGQIPASNIASVNITNFGTLSLSQGGTGATNAANARQNLGSTTVGDALFIATNAASARTTLGATTVGSSVFTATDAAAARTALSLGTAATNPSTAFQPAGTVGIASGGTGATNAGGARTNLGLGATNDVVFDAITANTALFGMPAIQFGNQGIVLFNGDDLIQIFTNRISFFEPIDFDSSAIAATTRSNLGLGAIWLTNTNVTNFRTAIGLGESSEPIFLNIRVTEALATNESIGFLGDGISFPNETSRSNYRFSLGLGWQALTNTNAGTGLVSVNTNGDVVSPTNFWQRAPIQTLVQDFTAIATSQTNNATNARNVYVYSFNTNVSGISNTIILPTNTSTFNGDEVTVIHKGTTNTTTVVRQAGSTNNLITLNRFDESVKFIRELGQWDFYHNISFVEPIQFSGTNVSANAAASRTNLGLGAANEVTFNQVNIGIANYSSDSIVYDGFEVVSWNTNLFLSSVPLSFNNTNNAATTRTNLGLGLSALTNTNNAGFQRAIFQTNSTPASAANLSDVKAWLEVSVVTNNVTNSFRLPLFQ